MMKKIFNNPTLFIFSVFIALFLMPGEMLNAKTRAQFIKEAEAAYVKARNEANRVHNQKYCPLLRKYLRIKKEFEKVAAEKQKTLKASKAAEAALHRARKLPMMPGHVPLGTWKRLPGLGLDIGVGAKGNAWVIGLNHVPYYWDGRAWRQTNGGLDRCDVDPLGRIWGVNKVNDIWLREKNGAWHKLPGKAIDIGCGGPGNGVTCIIGTNKQTYKWTGKKWLSFGGGAVRVDVDKNGNPWVVNQVGDIWWHEVKRKKWHKLTGKAIDISCGPDGSIWILGLNKTVYKWTGKTWVQGEGKGYHITVDHRGLPWVIGLDKGTWMLKD
ncbi:tectonin domain-containing protein [Candidatus Riflebacteria bacterium]